MHPHSSEVCGTLVREDHEVDPPHLGDPNVSGTRTGTWLELENPLEMSIWGFGRTKP